LKKYQRLPSGKFDSKYNDEVVTAPQISVSKPAPKIVRVGSVAVRIYPAASVTNGKRYESWVICYKEAGLWKTVRRADYTVACGLARETAARIANGHPGRPTMEFDGGNRTALRAGKHF